MIRDIEINTMEDLFEMISEQDYRADLGRHRNLFIYRGEPDATYTLSTSLRRHCKDKSSFLEAPMLLNFTKYAILQEPTIQDSVWNQMILGQHHGLPTRLLDWSFSPIVALHFSTTESDLEMMDARDAVIWRIDIHELHDMLPEKYRLIISKYNTTVFSVSMLREVCESPKQYDMDMQDKSMVIIEPPSLDPRIVNQYSFFSIIPDRMTDIAGFLNTYTDLTRRFIIKKELRWRIRDMLDPGHAGSPKHHRAHRLSRPGWSLPVAGQALFCAQLIPIFRPSFRSFNSADKKRLPARFLQACISPRTLHAGPFFSGPASVGGQYLPDLFSPGPLQSADNTCRTVFPFHSPASIICASGL